jgi:hypothetical protein
MVDSRSETNMQSHEILQALYDSEINCRIESFWDGGWTGWLGDEMNGFTLGHVRGRTFADCALELARQACSVYPDSAFAHRYRS